MTKSNDVIGLGNALMDFLVEVKDQHLVEFDLKKGEFHLVEEQKAQQLLQQIEQAKLKIEIVPGGSAANTLKGIAVLGGKVILCGKVGKDKHGEMYEQQLNCQGVISRLNKHHKATGQAITLITPDTERTFSVHLGAAVELKKEDVLEDDIANSKILHLEGYQLEGDTRETVLHAIKLAKKHYTKISIDLADPGVIRRNKIFMKKLISSADIIFLNENEAKELTGLEAEEALLELGKTVPLVIVKIGKKGSLIYDGSISYIDCYPAKAIDTTGAGDSYAAGFLYGQCYGWDLESSGKLGALLAAKVVEQKGVGMKGIDGEELKRKVRE